MGVFFGKKIVNVPDFCQTTTKEQNLCGRIGKDCYVGMGDLGWSLSGTGGFPREIILKCLRMLDTCSSQIPQSRNQTV